MSGLTKEVTAGETSLDDSTSRTKAVQNPNPQPAANPQQPEKLQQPGEDFQQLSLTRATVQQLSSSRAVYVRWILQLKETLSPEGKAIVRTAAFDQLKEVPHSTVAHSRSMSHVDLTRWDHCIHAAHTVGVLGKGGSLGLNPYEMKVLELVMLLHDPHRLGSHALDRVYASMPGGPKDFNSWWPADDYHEYHGARLICRDPAVREALGKYYDDVVAILTREDKRPTELKRQDYGVLQPKLSEKRLASLHRLKDEIDRCSYLENDYLRSGCKPKIIADAVAAVQRHQKTLAARGSGIQLCINEHTGHDPYNEVARLRYVYREKIATLAVGCLAERAIFHEGVWGKARSQYDCRYMESPAFYESVRDRAMQGDYEAIFSEEALALIEAAKTGTGLCVEDVYAPLVTMTLADMTEVSGFNALEETLPPGLSQSICGVPRKDMTLFEAGMRRALQEAGLNSNVHVLTSNDFGKTFEYDVSRKGQAPVREIAHHDCHDSLIKVIVAARAIDRNGDTVDLSQAKRVIEKFLRDSGYLKDSQVLESFNPRIFCDPVDPSIFCDAVREKFTTMQPAWIQRGGCGILK